MAKAKEIIFAVNSPARCQLQGSHRHEFVPDGVFRNDNSILRDFFEHSVLDFELATLLLGVC